MQNPSQNTNLFSMAPLSQYEGQPIHSNSCGLGETSLMNSPDYPQTLLDALYHMYQQQIGCDFMLIVQTNNASVSEFCVHKLVLMAGSGFFRALQDNAIHTDRHILTGMNPRSVESIINFLYTANLHLDRNNFWGIWSTASYLQIPAAIRLCDQYGKMNHLSLLDGQQRRQIPVKELQVDGEEANINKGNQHGQPVFNTPVTARNVSEESSVVYTSTVNFTALQNSGKFQNLNLEVPEGGDTNQSILVVNLDGSIQVQKYQINSGPEAPLSIPSNQDISSQQLPNSQLEQNEDECELKDMETVNDEILSTGSAMDLLDLESDVSERDDDFQHSDPEYEVATSDTEWRPTIVEKPTGAAKRKSRLRIVLSRVPEISETRMKNTRTIIAKKNVSKDCKANINAEYMDKGVEVELKNGNSQRKCMCVTCGAWFQHYSQLKLHCQRRHKVYKVDMKMFMKMFQRLQAARQSLEGRCLCVKCQKDFKYYTSWRNHFLRKHTGFYTCRMCREKCVSATHLRFHKDLHHKSGKLQLQACQWCSRQFIFSNTLKQHVRVVHRITRRKSATPQRIQPMQDSKEHTEIPKKKTTRKVKEGAPKVYVCNKCDATYSQRSRLKSHLFKVHNMKERNVLGAMKKSTKKIVGLYKCYISGCKVKFEDVLHLKAHLYKIHNLERGTATKTLLEFGIIPDSSKFDTENLTCSACDKTFLGKKSLYNHAKTVHGLKLLKLLPGKKVRECEIANCNFKVKTLKDMRSHMKEKHPTNKHRCLECKFRCSSEMELDHHRKKGHGGKRATICEMCGKGFRKHYYLKIHKFKIHKIRDEAVKVIKCDFEGCQYETTSSHSLRMHSQRHITDKPYSCPDCGRKLKTLRNLEKHINKVHKNIRPFMCHLCGMAYGDESELKNHINRAHVGIKPFQCPHCSYKSVDKHALKGHMFAMHRIKASDDQKIFKCDFCDYMCDRRTRLEKHMKAHLGIRDEVCPHCGKAFSHHHSLVNHIKWIHTAKTMRCDYCDYLTVDKWKLSQHIRTMHTHRGFKPYKCPYCDFHSATGGNCRKHVMNKHRGMKVGWIKVAEVPVPENPSAAGSSHTLSETILY